MPHTHPNQERPMSRPSTSELSRLLVEFGAATTTFTARTVKTGRPPMARGFVLTNETYGADSRVYLYCPDLSTRLRLEDFLKSKGVTTVSPEYSPGRHTAEVGVTYFKGDHWDE
jgi:hypothetical protein